MDLQLMPISWTACLTVVLLLTTLQESVSAATQCDGDKESCDTETSQCKDCHDKEDDASLTKSWWKSANSIYNFTVTDIDGNRVSLEKYGGHVCLIVNVASHCGFTSSNYYELQQLYYGLYWTRGLRILAFPCNQFGDQEPGTNDEIKQFAADQGVTFDMFAKVEVNGDTAEPLWRYLKYSYYSSEDDWPIPWNFSKFVINKDGKPVAYYSHATVPTEEDLQDYL